MMAEVIKLRRSRRKFVELIWRGLWPLLVFPVIALASVLGFEWFTESVPAWAVLMAVWVCPIALISLVSVLLKPIAVVTPSLIRWNRTETGPAGHLLSHQIADVVIVERDGVDYLKVFGGAERSLQSELAVQLDTESNKIEARIRAVLGL